PGGGHDLRCGSFPGWGGPLYLGLGGALNRGALLDRVRQLVCEQRAPRVGARLVLVAPEEDVVSGGEGAGAPMVAQAVGTLIDVDAYVAQVCAEPRLHERPHVPRECLPARGRVLDLGLRIGSDGRRALAQPEHLRLDVGRAQRGCMLATSG